MSGRDSKHPEMTLTESSSGQPAINPASNINIPKLTGKNYLNWKSIMTDMIIIRGLENVVFKREENRMLNLHAKLLIKSALDDTHLAEVRSYEQAYEMWNHLSRMCIGANSCDVAMLVRKFYNFNYTPDDNMVTHLEKLSTMREQLKDVDQAPTDEVFIDRIIQTLPSEYDRLKESWDYMHSSQKTIKELKQRILSIEEKQKHEKLEPIQQAYVVHNQAVHNRPRRTSIEERKRLTHCAKCGHKGHWAAECHTRPENYVNKDYQQSQQRHMPANNDHSKPQNNGQSLVFVVNHSNKLCNLQIASKVTDSRAFKVSTSRETLRNQWIADSGATTHICNNSAWFTDLELYDSPKTVSVGDDRSTQLLGIGKVEIISRVGKQQLLATIENVLLVPELATNLISISQLDAKGITASFANGEIQLIRNGQQVAHGTKNNNLWLMDMQAIKYKPKQQALLIQAKRSLEEWHRTLGHAGHDRVAKAIASHNLEIATSKQSQEVDCPDCPPGKAKHASHPSLNRRAEEVGERVFIDLAGPIETSSSGFNYFLLCKDEHSTYTYIYCLKGKAHMHLALAKLFTEFEVETGHRILRIHSDQGSEFLNNKVEQLLALEHAIHETSAAYTPQQNGLVEREIQSITQMARTMLLSADVPPTMWDEAVKTACFIRNRLPNKSVSTSPYEAATGRRPSITHLCEFGRQVHIVIDDHYLRKFDARTEEGYVVGFTSRSNTYRVMFKNSSRVTESCNVIFKPHKTKTKMASDEPRGSVLVNVSAPQKSPLDRYFEELEARGFSMYDDSFETATEQDSHDQGEQPTEERRTNEEPDPSEQQESDDPTLIAQDDDIESPPYSPLTINQDDVPMALLVSNYIPEPMTYKEAITSTHKVQWIKAIQDEFEAHRKNRTWVVMDHPHDKTAMSTKWVFKVKMHTDGTVDRFKARLVARGFEQRAGFDYRETFAPVAKYETIRTLVALAAQDDLIIRQFDITTAFLYGTLEDDVYIKPPEGMELESGKALKLMKGLYGLKQAPRVWNEEFTKQVEKLGFEATKSDPCLFNHQTRKILLCIYVDDGLVLARQESDLAYVLDNLMKVFEMKTVTNSTFVGLRIQRYNLGYIIHQVPYTRYILEKYRMDDCRSVTAPLIPGHRLTEVSSEDKNIECPYREAIGALMYLATKTRPDILYATTLLAKFCEQPKDKHWLAVKRLMRYLRGTENTFLKFERQSTLGLCVYTDADWGSDALNRKSITGTLITMAGGPVIFRSSQQGLVAMSTTEAEFVAAAESVRDAVWLQSLLKELKIEHDPTELKCDSQTAIRLINNPEFPRRTKHIDIKFHFIRDLMKKGHFKLQYIPTDKQLADFLTKALPRDQFKFLITAANVMQEEQSGTSERGGVLV